MDSYDLYLMDADGGNAHRVAEGLVDLAGGPAWAPGGGRLVFGRAGSRSAGGGDGEPGLWMLNVHEGTETRLTDCSLHHEFGPRRPREFDPRFSPDGRQVVFERVYGDGVEGLPSRVVIVDTVTTEEKEVPLPGTARCPANLVDCLDPAWSADGTRLAFVQQAWGVPRELWTFAVAGGRPQRLTGGPGDEDLPAWSPDGRRVAFAANGLYVMTASGADPRPVRQWPRSAPRELSWAPDSRHIAVVLSRSGGGGLEVVDTETGEAVSTPGDVHSVSWSPDGDCLAFGMYDPPVEYVGQPGVRFLICRVNADGTGLTVLTPEGVHDASPAWEPGK